MWCNTRPPVAIPLDEITTALRRLAVSSFDCCGEAMVMLTLARFILEKTGGDSMAEVRDNLDRYTARIAQPPAAPVAGDGTGGHGSVAAAGGRWVEEVAADASEDS